MYRTITVETNRYAATYITSHDIKSSSRFKKWPENGITEEDVKRFFSLVIVMGLVVQEDMKDYWTTDPVLETPFFRTVMRRDTFLNVMTFLHLADNAGYKARGDPDYQPLFKLGTIYTQLIKNFRDVWYPGQSLSLDEGMIPYRGKTHMRVYNPDKPDKYGLKAYMVCDSRNAYCSEFELYTGRSDEPTTHGKTYDLVMRLMAPYLHKGHHLYVDNYYTSPTLFLDLYNNGVGATGTARNRKGIPSKLKDGKVKIRGDKVVVHSGVLMAMKLKDRKEVKVLSTIHSSKNIPTGKRERGGEEIKKPEAIIHYNKNMGAVDRSDQMIGYSSMRRRTLKWWKKALFHIFSLSILNSYIIYKDWCSKHQKKPLLQRLFRRDLVKAILASVGGTTISACKGRPKSTVLDRLTERHFPDHTIINGKKMPRRCVVCGPGEKALLSSLHREVSRKAGKESIICCKECDVGLCPVPCFRLYHTYEYFVLAYKRLRLKDMNITDSNSESEEDIEVEQ